MPAQTYTKPAINEADCNAMDKEFEIISNIIAHCLFKNVMILLNNTMINKAFAFDKVRHNSLKLSRETDMLSLAEERKGQTAIAF